MSDPSKWKRNDTLEEITNILEGVFVCEYLDDNNNVNRVQMKAGESRLFPSWVAKVLIKHMIDAYLNERKWSIMSPQERYDIEVIIRSGGIKPANLPRNIVQLDRA